MGEDFRGFRLHCVQTGVSAGKHLLDEKPMCVTLREADLIVAAQKQSGAVVQVGYMRRCAPAFLDGCALVRDIGEIKYARVRDIIGANAMVISSTSRVIHDPALLESIEKETENRENALVEEILLYSRRSVPALHLFKGAQTETVRLLFDASANF